MVAIIFTYGSSPISKMIRFLTGEPVSHVAIYNRDTKIITHSNFYGVHQDTVADFLAHSTVSYSVPRIDIDPRAVDQIFAENRNKGYDFGALLFLGLKALAKRLGIKTRPGNLWQSSGMFLCTEWVTYVVDGHEDHEVTPYQLYLRLAK